MKYFIELEHDNSSVNLGKLYPVHGDDVVDHVGTLFFLDDQEDHGFIILDL